MSLTANVAAALAMPESSSHKDQMLQPPAGQTVNLVDPQTLMPAVIAVGTTVCLLATAFVLARFYTKAFVARTQQVEDYLSYLAYVGLVTYTALFGYASSYGLARHVWDIPHARLSRIIYYTNVLNCLYCPTTLAAKLSALFQIKRLFAVSKRNAVWWVVITSVAMNIGFYLALFLSYIFQCWPREKIWDIDGSVQGTCVSASSSNLAAGFLNLVSDIEVLLLPAWAIWHLQLPVKRKLGIYAVFGVGSIACIIGSGGIVVRVKALHDPDVTRLSTDLSLQIISEIAIVIVVGCFPVLPRLYGHLRRPPPTTTSTWPSERAYSQTTSDRSLGRRKRMTDDSVADSMAKYLGRASMVYSTTPMPGGLMSSSSFRPIGETGEAVLGSNTIASEIPRKTNSRQSIGTQRRMQSLPPLPLSSFNKQTRTASSASRLVQTHGPIGSSPRSTALAEDDWI